MSAKVKYSRQTQSLKMHKPKIGAVSYLNTKPLVAGMDVDARSYDLVFDLPSRLADRLAAGDLDVALIPVIEAVTHAEYTILSDACIACRGPVWSVKLFSKVPAAQIQTLALDEGSRTSQALARVYLANKFGVRPACETLPIDQHWEHSNCDAVLVIGDRAMKKQSAAFPFSLDLGSAWNDWKGLPFVFAVWAARPGTDFEAVGSLLSEARDTGLRCLSEIAIDQAGHYNLSVEDCSSYLNQHIHYYLDEDGKRAMELYFQHAAELSLIPKHLELRFHESLLS